MHFWHLAICIPSINSKDVSDTFTSSYKKYEHQYCIYIPMVGIATARSAVIAQRGRPSRIQLVQY